MNNKLSVSEDQSSAIEADAITLIAEKHSAQLFKFKVNQTIDIDNITFRCVSSDKNIIFKVSNNLHWFLKYSLNKEWVNREIIGATAVKTTLGGFDGYKHPNVIRASETHRYTLYSSMDGIDFNTMLIKACLISTVKPPNFIEPVMTNIGRSIGRLHSYKISPELQALNPTNLHYIKSYISELKETNSIIDKILYWIEINPTNSDSIGWIHGNIKSEDIIISNNKITLIDFGTCGSGESYEDLTNLCAYMWLLRSVPLFPWRMAQHSMSALFQGYANERRYDNESIATHICYGIFRYYIKNVVMENRIATLSKMPIYRSRMNHLILNLLEGDHQVAFQGL